MRNLYTLILIVAFLQSFNLVAQVPDSSKVIEFQEVIIKENQSINGKENMPIIKENVI